MDYIDNLELVVAPTEDDKLVTFQGLPLSGTPLDGTFVDNVEAICPHGVVFVKEI